jgi:pimeloyl-ACP methyl ester carboxylesterase
VAVVGVASGVRGFDGGGTPAEREILEAYEKVDTAEPFDAAALTEFEVGIWGDGPGQPAGRVATSVRERLYEMDLPLNDPASVKGREIPLDPPANDRLAELRCPVLMVAGTLDFSDTVKSAEHIVAEVPNARELVWDDVAHMIGMEQPDRLAAATTNFLAPLDRWA